MDIRQLKYFIAVVETKNISKAARNLFITQPTLSQSLRKLETELNANLFNHHNKTFQLTHTGKLLYEKGKSIVESFDELVEELQNIQEQKTEKLKIGLTSLFALQFMRQISKFISTHPNVEVYLTQEGSRKLQEKLVENQIDIALVSFPIEQEGIHIEPLNTTTKGYEVSVVLPTSNPLSDRKSLGFKDLKNENFCSLTENFMLGKLLIERGKELNFTPKIAYTHSDWEILVHSLHDLNAVTLLPSDYEDYNHVENLKWIPLADKNNFYPIGIGLREDFPVTELIHEFIDMIKQN
ncbi:LysR family transcriptional regulator [Macrococcus sp. DPC7161]|uniref:LysR family transcriptional regulator n=1 Tax=Macrococcus sp. DPC7161 TaxID=2507060 RepID=UPI00100A9033|nr:LysR family transcriptional regulator [Macrococcus sp. DPC7161]RXK18919.1 LysR family transcriptional regulator [Macrococcus sp. DPC7161]